MQKLLLALCSLSSSYRVAGRQARADDSSLGVDDGDVVKLEVTCSDALADCKGSYVYGEVIGQILEETADFQFATAHLELTAGLYAYGVTGDEDGNLYDNGLVVVHCEEVCVESLVVYGMILYFVKKRGDLGAVYIEVNDVAIRGVGEGLELFCVYCERDVLNAVAINYARHLALAAYLAHVSFAAYGSLGTGDGKMFH